MYLSTVEKVQLVLVLGRGGAQHCRVGIGGRVTESSGLSECTAPHTVPSPQEPSAHSCEDDIAVRMVSQHAPSSTQSRMQEGQAIGGLSWEGSAYPYSGEMLRVTILDS